MDLDVHLQSSKLDTANTNGRWGKGNGDGGGTRMSLFRAAHVCGGKKAPT